MWHHDWNHNKCRSPWSTSIYHGPVILPYIFCASWCMIIIIWDYESVWSDRWLNIRLTSQVYVGQWPILYGPAILLHVLKTISREMIDQCHSDIDLVNSIWVGVTNISWSIDFCLISWSLTRHLSGYIRDPLSTCSSSWRKKKKSGYPLSVVSERL